MDWQRVRSELLCIYGVFPTFIAMVMGVLLTIRGIWEIYKYFSYGDMTGIALISHVVMLIAGIFIIIYGKKDMIRTIGLYALTLGFTRLLLRYEMIQSGTLGPVTTLMVAVMMALALNLMYTGISFARGLVIRRTSMILTTGAMTAFNLILIVFAQYLEEIPEAAPLLAEMTTKMIEVLMYLVLIVMLDAEEIRYGTSDGKHIRHLDRIRANYRIDKDAYISPEAADCLMNKAGPLWKEVNDGTVEKEMSFKVTGRSMGAVIIAQIWSGKEPLYLTVIPKDGTIVYANRMKIDIVERTDDAIHFYGRDGQDFHFGIEEEELE